MITLSSHFLVSVFFPFLQPLLGKLKIGFFDKEVIDFFGDLSKKAIAERKTSEAVSPTDEHALTAVVLQQ